jgi:RNA polymerase primary sigma factor
LGRNIDPFAILGMMNMAKLKDKKKTIKKQAVVIEPPIVDQLQDIEARRTRLKALIVLGKERGYLTYAEINDHLPDMLEVEQIEGVVSMINEMGVLVYDVAPDAEALIMTDVAPAVADEDAVEEAEAALSTVDSEFGRTTDPVRMYMREIGHGRIAHTRKRNRDRQTYRRRPETHDSGDFRVPGDHR